MQKQPDLGDYCEEKFDGLDCGNIVGRNGEVEAE